jgi:hypothetical protein
VSGAGKWVKDNPLASLGILAATVATAGAAAPALGAGAAAAGAAGAGAAGAGAAGLGGGTASLFGPSAGLATGLLSGGAPVAAGMATAAPGIAGAFGPMSAAGLTEAGMSPLAMMGAQAAPPSMFDKFAAGFKSKGPDFARGMMQMDQGQEQQPMPMDPRQQMPALQQQPLGLPGGFDMPPMDINGPMTEEERKWRMLLAQLQGASQ